ncbi:MAG: dihydrodipicolinate reductase [Nocardia sp.]|nr:dihydrodipicolinate reductase [Nocardia sp.]
MLCSSLTVLRDLLPLAVLSLTERADHILVQEVFDYSSYGDAGFTGASFGFGTTPDNTPALFHPGVLTPSGTDRSNCLPTRSMSSSGRCDERYETWVAVEPIDSTVVRVEPVRSPQLDHLDVGIAGQSLLLTIHVLPPRMTPPSSKRRDLSTKGSLSMSASSAGRHSLYV